ncbi:hypothetical protein [Metapseudomonas boanensis]|uniref:Uncharacterized protein n=1 Tax=Metapseudomonas boanensis TaxID=2822138 RepID=A0ABS5XH34_9GAMM|nr:hypothetical protein [Pseudomonas boanensis]MBT8765647.1 hypothetical protein [Pseudomonas boanensis]
MRFSGKQALRIWGVLDLFQVAWYSLNSWHAGRIPYWSDLSSTLALHDQLGTSLSSAGLLAWTVHLSIAVTGVLFVLGYRPARYLGLAQIPLRLFFLYPSVSLLLPLAGHVPGLVMLVLVIGSELLKGWSLWRRV